jgi:hypothetical protein
MKEQDIVQVKISLLKNAAIFFFDAVFIVNETNRYRLIVAHRSEKLCDTEFLTLRGDRIAFEKLFRHRKAAQIKPEWTPFFAPETNWLKEKLNYLNPIVPKIP